MERLGDQRDKKFWQWAIEWQAVGAMALALVGLGATFGTAFHPYIADGCFAAGFLLFLIKLWFWEDGKFSLAVVTASVLLALVGSTWFDHHQNIPKPSDSAIVESNPNDAPKTPQEAEQHGVPFYLNS